MRACGSIENIHDITTCHFLCTTPLAHHGMITQQRFVPPNGSTPLRIRSVIGIAVTFQSARLTVLVRSFCKMNEPGTNILRCSTRSRMQYQGPPTRAKAQSCVGFNTEWCRYAFLGLSYLQTNEVGGKSVMCLPQLSNHIIFCSLFML